MKKLFYFTLLANLCFIIGSCNEGQIVSTSNKQQYDYLKQGDSMVMLAIEELKSPCTDCYLAAQTKYINCINNAGDDDAARKACLQNLNMAIANCKLGPCPKVSQISDVDARKITIEEALKMAESDLKLDINRKKSLVTKTVWGLGHNGGAYTWYQADPICSFNAGICSETNFVSAYQGGTCYFASNNRQLFLITYYE